VPTNGASLVGSSPTKPPTARRRAWLAELLIYDRDFGLAFEDVYEENVAWTLERIAGRRRDAGAGGMRVALEATLPAWRAAWDRRPGPGDGLTQALLDALSEPKSRHSQIG